MASMATLNMYTDDDAGAKHVRCAAWYDDLLHTFDWIIQTTWTKPSIIIDVRENTD